MMIINHSRYHSPDPAFVDAIYSFEAGGLNPVRDRATGWASVPGQAQNSLLQYRRGRMIRSCYQGCHRYGVQNGRA
jgi:hypothetical protein